MAYISFNHGWAMSKENTPMRVFLMTSIKRFNKITYTADQGSLNKIKLIYHQQIQKSVFICHLTGSFRKKEKKMRRRRL
jgi:hypothetical protein